MPETTTAGGQASEEYCGRYHEQGGIEREEVNRAGSIWLNTEHDDYGRARLSCPAWTQSQ